MIVLKDLVHIRSECLLNGCSGEVVDIRPQYKTYIVLMPNDKRLAFGYHEVEKYSNKN